jgi:putative transposase
VSEADRAPIIAVRTHLCRVGAAQRNPPLLCRARRLPKWKALQYRILDCPGPLICVGWINRSEARHTLVCTPSFNRNSSISDYRRWLSPGSTYFFTAVTHERRAIFQDREAIRVLGEVLRDVRQLAWFRNIAIVVLPDHLHCVWTLPPNDCDFSTRLRLIKSKFTNRWRLNSTHEDAPLSASRQRKGERGIWQRRFWEHLVRDEFDLERCVDYIHYNPVKHGYVSAPMQWNWSSFHRFVAKGHYAPAWGRTLPTSLADSRLDFGE